MFFDKLGDTWNIIKSSFTLFGENPEMFKAYFFLAYLIGGFTLFIILSFLIGLFFPVMHFLWILALIIALILSPFIKTFILSAHSWVVYNVAKKKSITFNNGIDRAKQNIWDIIPLTIVGIIVNYIVSWLRERRGFIISIIANFFAWILEEGWDLIYNFTLPAMIVTDKTFMQAIPESRKVVNNIPGTLVGVLGIDWIAKMIIGPITAVFGLILLFLIIMSFMFNSMASIIAILIILTVIITYAVLTYFSGVVALFKVNYFTLLYMQLTEPNFLKENNTVSNFFDNIINKNPKKKGNLFSNIFGGLAGQSTITKTSGEIKPEKSSLKSLKAELSNKKESNPLKNLKSELSQPNLNKIKIKLVNELKSELGEQTSINVISISKTATGWTAEVNLNDKPYIFTLATDATIISYNKKE